MALTASSTVLRSDGWGGAGRLEARRAEIEVAVLARVFGIAGSPRAVGVEYAAGLRAAVAAAIDFGIAAVADRDGLRREVPAALLVQARLAARNGVELGVVLRRYAAGHSLLSRCLVEEAQAAGVPCGDLAALLDVQATLFDRIVAAVTEEYGRERTRPASLQHRRLQVVKGLMLSDCVDTGGLGYDFDGHHVAIVASGEGCIDSIGAFAGELGARRLVVTDGDDTVWMWLGDQAPPTLDLASLRTAMSSSDRVAIGEPGQGISGWRRSHRQANAAHSVAKRQPGIVTRYADVALVASVAQDDLLTSSLRDLYIAPLHDGHDDGDKLVETLCAYFTAGRNGASAAAMLGVSRAAVQQRLRVVENRLDRSLMSCGTSLEVALSLERLADGSACAQWRL